MEDGAYCLSYLLFAGSKRTLAKSLPFRHWPDAVSAFKGYGDPKKGVHSKYMFDYNELLDRLKEKTESISSVSSELIF